RRRQVAAPSRPATRPPPTPAPTAPPAAPFAPATDTHTWLLRDARSGEVRQFRELTILQQWIVERRATRDDQISHGGNAWKTLGSIPEFAPFFRVVDMAARGVVAPAPSPRTAALGRAETLMAMPAP